MIKQIPESPHALKRRIKTRSSLISGIKKWAIDRRELIPTTQRQECIERVKNHKNETTKKKTKWV